MIDPRTCSPVLVPRIGLSATSLDLRIEELEAMLSTGGFRMEPIPREALFLAGTVFRQYRHRGGTKTGVLPDFPIGAHAAVAGIPLLTRDPRRYRGYFPGLDIIHPE